VSAAADDLDQIIDRLTTVGLVKWGEPVALSSATVDHLVSTAAHQGLVCLLGAAMELGHLVLADDDTVRVRDAWGDVLARVVQLDALLLEVTDCLAAARVDTRVLKGAAVATLDEFDPAWRSYNDVDVLVPPDQLLHAVDALAALDLRPITFPVSRRWAGRYAKSITLHHPGGAQVDLHRMLATGPFGTRLRAGCLFADGRPLAVGGRQLTALSDAHRFLHACYHAMLGGVQGPRHRRDILLLAQTTSPESIVAQTADGWSLTLVHSALTWAYGTSAEPPHAWAEWLATHPLDPTEAALVASSGGSFHESARAQLRAARGPLAKLRYGAALVWPSRAHLRDRGQTRRQHLLRLLRTGRRGRTVK
jgi:hypothetical protein